MTVSTSLRAWLERKVIEGTPTVVAVQRFLGVTPQGPTIWWLHGLMSIGAALGNEPFFIVFIPCLFWEGDWMVARRMTYLWGASYYAGQIAKDLVMLPRPPASVVLDCASPASVVTAWRTPRPTPKEKADASATQGVIRLERHYETEGGFPSTHAMNAISMPWLITYLILTSGRFDNNNANILYAIASAWTVLCTSSRLYLGVHSPADVIGGLVLGASLLALNIALGNSFDSFIMSGTNEALLAVPLLTSTLIYLYPRPAEPHWLSTPGDTAVVLGSVTGICVGSAYLARDRLVASLSSSTPIVFPSTPVELGAALVRTLIGVVVLVLTRAVFKTAATFVLVALLGHKYVPADSEAARQLVGISGEDRHSATTVVDDEQKQQREGEDPAALPAVTKQPPTSGGSKRRAHVDLAYDDSSSSTSTQRKKRHGEDEEDEVLEKDADGVPRLRIKAPASAAASTSKDSKSGTNGLVRVPPHRRYGIELPVKLITYGMIGLNAVFVVRKFIYQELPAPFGKNYGL